LNSLYLTAFWSDGLNVEIEGLSGGLGGTLLDDVTETINTTGSTLVNLSWTGIHTVAFFPSGGTQNPNFLGSGTQFAFDNLAITPSVVPLPGALPLFASRAHGELAAAKQELLRNAVNKENGYGFLPVSDQSDLSVQDYGTAIAFPSFVIKQCLNHPLRLHSFTSGNWFGLQDEWIFRRGDK
jgi:hypothetical protein